MIPSIRYSIQPSAAIAFPSIGYLLISSVLWIANWFNWWISIPTCLLLLYGFWKLRHEIRQSFQEHKTIPVWYYIFAISYACICVFLCGFDGRVPQSWDFIIRNPIYTHLIELSWPMKLHDGEVVIYPMSFWLVPAALSKAIPSFSIIFLQIWMAIGLVFVSLNLSQTLGCTRSVLAHLCLTLIAPLSLIADDILNVVFHIDAFYSTHFRLPSLVSQLFCTFHFYVALCLILSLLVYRHTRPKLHLYIAAFLPVFHPMMSAVLLPWIAYSVLRKQRQERKSWLRLLHPYLYGSILVVILAGIYFSSASGSEIRIVFEAPYAKGYNIQSYAAFLSGIILNALPLLLIWFFNRKGVLLYLACCIPVLMLIWMGQGNGISEWWYKFTIPYTFILTVSAFINWQKNAVKTIIIVLLIISIPSFLRELQHKNLPAAAANGFAKNQQNIIHPYRTMNDINESLRKQFVSDNVTIPALFRYLNNSSDK